MYNAIQPLILFSKNGQINAIKQEIANAPQLSNTDCLKQLENTLNHNKNQDYIEF